MGISRRKALSELGGLAIGSLSLTTAVGVLGPSANAQEANSVKSSPVIEYPWDYHKLDQNKVAERAYKGYFLHSCMFGVFESIIGELADKYGEPYASFPSQMMAYGGGGVVDWGTLCGALNGAAAVIELVAQDPKKLTSELFAWSERTALPNVKLDIRATKNDKFPSSSTVTNSISGSVLCHVIMSKWIEASGKGIDSAEKKQRCSQFAASIASKVVQLLNDEADDKLVFSYPLTKQTAGCVGCHSGKKSRLKNTQGKMDCQSCHVDHTR